MASKSKIQVGLRVDVDTYRGTRNGVPQLLKLFGGTIKASFFFSLGPDNMGRHLWRLRKLEFLKKMLRSNAGSLYGWDILLRGTFWPGPKIGKQFGPIIRTTAEIGHEVGLHAWDHHRWQTQLEYMSLTEIAHELHLGMDKLIEILGRKPSCSAVAGWRCKEQVLLEKNAYWLKYHSDCRGNNIFRPLVNGMECTPQIPVTLPTYDEIIGRNGITDADYNEYLLSLIKPDRLNVYTIHAEVEGIARLVLFTEFLGLAASKQVQFLPLGDLLPNDREEIPFGKIESRPVQGREGDVCWQAHPPCVIVEY